MFRFVSLKNGVIFLFSAYFIFCFGKTYIGLVFESIDAAAGYLMGMVSMGLAIICMKCVRYLCRDVEIWMAERKEKKRMALIAKWQVNHL